MNVREALARREQERALLADRLARLLADDPRVLAGWLHGSVGRGEADGLSDLDVTVVVADESVAAAAGGPGRPTTYARVRTSARGRFVTGLGAPTLLTEAPQNASAGGAFLSSFFPGEYGPHGVDWEWVPRSTATRPERSVVLLDRSGATAPDPSGRPDHDSGGPPPSDPEPRAPLEVAVAECCSFWSMLVWAGKYAARADPDACATLLAYAVRSLDVVSGFAGGAASEGPDAAGDERGTHLGRGAAPRAGRFVVAARRPDGRAAPTSGRARRGSARRL